MEYLLVVSMIWILVVGFGLGYFTSHDMNNYEARTLKRENERLNAELHKLTDRDSKGRFVGNKSK